MKKLLLVVAFVACAKANAEFFSGNDLLSNINSTDALERMLALGYVMGVSDSGDSILHCAPAGVTAGQVRDVVKGALIASPGTRHHSADSLVVKALRNVWPCKDKKGSNT